MSVTLVSNSIELFFRCIESLNDGNLMTFDQFGLSSALLSNLLKLGYTTPTPIQAQAIPAIGSGIDLVATAQTGTGKTAAFLLPILQKLLDSPRGATRALILAPTRELAQQIESVFRNLSFGTRLRSVLVVGGLSPFPQEKALRAGVDLVVATPGRLLDHIGKGAARLNSLKTLVLDEADQMFDLGFIPDIRSIVAALPSERQTLLFSATMPTEIERLCRSILNKPQKISVGEQGKSADTVQQIAYPVATHRKTALLLHLIEQWETPSVLVFTRTKHGARKLTDLIYEAGHGVAELHGNRSPTQRAKALKVFQNKMVPVMVATNIAARGIDVRHITHVVNFDVPQAPEEYVHRIGRTGRAGDNGNALIFVSPEENALLSRIERQLRQRLPRQHVEDFDYGANQAPQHKKLPSSNKNQDGRDGAKKKAFRGKWKRSFKKAPI